VTTAQNERPTAVPSAAELPRPAEPEMPQIYEFVEPIPGFPDEREFVLAPIDSEGVLYSLRSLRSLRSPDRSKLALLPPRYFPYLGPPSMLARA
jgi:hypothetical protein